MNEPLELHDDLVERMLRRRSARGDSADLAIEIRAAVDAVPRRSRRLSRAGRWLPAPVVARPGPVMAGLGSVAGVAVIALGLLAVLGLGGLVGPRGVTPGAPSPSPSASPTLSEPALPEGFAPLPAGTHASGFFWPRLTFTVPAGYLTDGDSPEFFGLVPATIRNLSSIRSGGQAVAFVDLFRELEVAAGDCGEAAEPDTGDSAIDIVTALVGRPGLTVQGPTPITVGGLNGWQLDLALADGWTGSCPGVDGPFVPLVYKAGLLHWGAEPGERFRLIVLDIPVPDATVTILVYARDAEAWGELLASSTALVDSFELDVDAARPRADCYNGAPTCGGVLFAGEHRTVAFEPAFSYRTPGMWANPIDIGGYFELFTRGFSLNSENSFLGMWSKASILDPDTGCDRPPDAVRNDGVQAWVDFLRSHPGLEASAATPVTIGGASGQSIDVDVVPGRTEPCAIGWSYERGQPPYVGLYGDRPVRIMVLDVGGRTVLIAVYGPLHGRDAPAARLAAAANELRPFLDSIRFEQKP